MNEKLLKFAFFFGGILIVVSAVSIFFEQRFSPYLFAAGAALVVFYQFMESLKVRKSNDKRLQRLRRLAFLSSTLLVAGAYLMFIHSNLWALAVFIYALTTFFLSFRGGESPEKQD